jgi:cysteine desulfurase
MTAGRIYLDHNASAPLLEAARAAMVDALAVDANPSSVHAAGRDARRLVEAARRQVAALVNGDPANVTFTSGATEAASSLLTPDWRMGRAPLCPARLIVCAADHPATLSGGHFPADRVARVGVDADGIVRLDDLASLLASRDGAQGPDLVAIHLANNETGVIQPVGRIAALVRAAGAILVLDAVQAAGRIPLDIADGCADFLILSSHKIGGPKGAGAVVAAGSILRPAPLVIGGGQEHGHRAGTENVAAIAGFGAAATAVADALSRMADIARLRDRFEAAIEARVSGAPIFGKAAPRLANTTFFAIPGMSAETAQIAFDLEGIAISAGSACSSGKVGPSHVLAAMGHGAYGGALRVSIGHRTGEDDLAGFVTALDRLVSRKERTTKAA